MLKLQAIQSTVSADDFTEDKEQRAKIKVE